VARPASSPIRFGVFELDLDARELRRRGTKIKLQDQPFDLLAALLERPGKVVTREQLRARVWAAQTFVDFDLGLNKAVNRIREALGDTASTPRFIETLPRRGYRFIAPLDARSAGDGESPLLRASLLAPAGNSFVPNHFAISPDGTRLAFVGCDVHRNEALWIRDLASGRAHQLSGTQGARAPFWRPDSSRVGFFAEGKLKTIDIAGGALRTLCDARVALGGAWHADDVIIFAGQVSGPINRIAAAGGTPTPVTPEPGEQSGQAHCWPIFLPGTDRFLYFANRTSPADAARRGLYTGSLSSSEVRLISSAIGGNVAFAGGNLLFVKDGGLNAQPFDCGRLELSGEPVAIVPHELEIWETVFFRAAFSASDGGVLVFQSREDFARALVWTDSSGHEHGQITGGYWEPHISPDGRLIAVASDEFRDGRWYICVHDIDRGVTTRLTERGHESHPSWSPDGRRISFDSIEGDTSCTYEINADGSGARHLLSDSYSVLGTTSCNGAVAFCRVGHGSPRLIARLPDCEESIDIGAGVEHRFSPDGKWIAFTEYGGFGIGVRPFPGPGPRIQISNGPGAQPRWSRDGTQLFYIAPDKMLMGASFDSQSGRAGPPHGLFRTRIVGNSLVAWQYDVAPDGRFLINSLPAGSPPLTLLIRGSYPLIENI
jgi:eukaryotic-like serine/threonine-protein kinase